MSRDDLREDEIQLRRAVQEWAELELLISGTLPETPMRITTAAGTVVVHVVAEPAEQADDAAIRFSNLELRP